MTDLPLGTKAERAGTICGRAYCAIVNQPTQRVTHLVVRDMGLRHTQHLVPVDQVKQASRDVTGLGCPRDESAAIEPFIETDRRPKKGE